MLRSQLFSSIINHFQKIEGFPTSCQPCSNYRIWFNSKFPTQISNISTQFRETHYWYWSDNNLFSLGNSSSSDRVSASLANCLKIPSETNRNVHSRNLQNISSSASASASSGFYPVSVGNSTSVGLHSSLD